MRKPEFNREPLALLITVNPLVNQGVMTMLRSKGTVRENAFRINKTGSGLRYYTRQNGEHVWVPTGFDNRYEGWQVNEQQFQSLQSVYNTIADSSRGLEKMLKRAWLGWIIFGLASTSLGFRYVINSQLGTDILIYTALACLVVFISTCLIQLGFSLWMHYRFSKLSKAEEVDVASLLKEMSPIRIHTYYEGYEGILYSEALVIVLGGDFLEAFVSETAGHVFDRIVSTAALLVVMVYITRIPMSLYNYLILFHELVVIEEGTKYPS